GRSRHPQGLCHRLWLARDARARRCRATRPALETLPHGRELVPLACRGSRQDIAPAKKASWTAEDSPRLPAHDRWVRSRKEGGSMNLEGGCACRAIRYRLTDTPLIVHACHCRDCQRLTGSAFVINIWIEKRCVEASGVAPSSFELTTGSGNKQT